MWYKYWGKPETSPLQNITVLLSSKEGGAKDERFVDKSYE
jgi:hypothetical protein